ncbi:cysteine desulfurase [Candidatus Pacearchaeota archaeon]|nr:MAG: cysteine desulfurase [Candidatus Pacearchaeota archaeon]
MEENQCKLYLDNASTTRPFPEVVEEMSKCALENFGNPSSIHSAGERAHAALEKARASLATAINARPEEIIFTSGATESNNLAIFGLTKLARNGKKKVLVSSIEHPSVLEPCAALSSEGFEVVKVPCDSRGIVDAGFIEKHISQACLVCVMHVNNVVGTIQEVEKIGEICAREGVHFHVDAVQSFAKLDIDVRKFRVTTLSASAHKIHGPKGAGLLYLSRNAKLAPILLGGGQEQGLRSGTQNLPAILGFAKAAEILTNSRQKFEAVRQCRDELMEKLEKLGCEINGSKSERIFNNINFTFKGIESDMIVMFFSRHGICVSSGSACASQSKGEEHVMRAIRGKRDNWGGVRVTLAEPLTEKEKSYFLKVLKSGIEKLKVE